MTTAMSSGSVFSRYFAIGAPLSLSPDPLHEGSYLLNTGSAKTIHTDLQPLLLYNTDAPFSAEKWMLLGVTDKNDLLSFPHMVARIAILASIVSCAAAIVLGCAIITLLTRPIRLLINSLRASNPHRPVTLSKLYVTEIDELSSAIEDLSRRVSEASSTLSRIIEVSDINIAAFECDRVSGMVVCTGQFFPLLGLPCTGTEQDSIPIAEFKNAFENNDFVLEEELENGWILRMMADKKPRWIKITMVDEGTRLLGVVVDITEDTLSKRRIEYERDYDLLTNLLNRRAFLAALRKLLETPEELQTAALMLLDLDNLKYINDSYGHDCGDGYLRAMANTIKKLPLQNMVPARMSGDEFFVFLYGFESKEQLRRSIDELKSIIAESYYILPGGETIRIRCSGGIAWYPDDATTLEDLPRFADFAMYVAKNTKKGDFCEFNRQEYNKNSYLLHSREELNKLIEHRLVDYVFQPIVNALTGQVFAYEALMRSRLETLRTPMEILALARAQSKLYDIEKMTWMTALKKATSDPVFLESSCHIFINSVSNHILTEADIEELRASYQKYLSRMVLEVTEEEKFNEELTRHKQAILYSWGGQVALDDFGTGYNGEMVLLQLVPDYVKIDMSIVRNIDTDPSRRELFRNLVSYSHERDIKVIAEGVETLAEMEALIRLGADFLQGYYLGTPQSAMQTLSAEAVKEIQDTAKNCGREASNI